MVNRSVVKIVKKYLRAVSERGIPVSAGVIFGSYATGTFDKWSDIDLLVVSPSFDGKRPKRRDIDRLWHIAADIDSRIEPIAVGVKQYKDDDSSSIIEVARREGKIIPLAE